MYGSPLQPYTAMVFTGSGLMGRETHNIHSSSFVLFIGGRSGTLGEFCIAYNEGKVVGVLTDSGGTAANLHHEADFLCSSRRLGRGPSPLGYRQSQTRLGRTRGLPRIDNHTLTEVVL
ncbi:MAG: hypothetical protein ABI182_01975 [Candidatus Baltobacteraceae bacterium]